MPVSAKHPCNSIGCRELVSTRFCDNHKSLVNAGRAASDKQYGTARWKRLRAAKLARDPLCEMCLRDDRITKAVPVDHIKPVLDGGDMFEYSNLQSLCRNCHDIKTRDDLERRRGGVKSVQLLKLSNESQAFTHARQIE